MSNTTKSSDFEPLLDPDDAGIELLPPARGLAVPARRRKAAADAEIVTMVTLALSDRVIEYFQANGENWQADVNEALNMIVNRHMAREAKKRARLRARNSVRRRQPRARA